MSMYMSTHVYICILIFLALILITIVLLEYKAILSPATFVVLKRKTDLFILQIARPV